MIDKRQELLNRIQVAEKYKRNLPSDNGIDYYEDYVYGIRMKLYSLDINEARKRRKFFLIIFGALFGAIFLAFLGILFFDEKEISLAPISDTYSQNLDLRISSPGVSTWDLNNKGKLGSVKLFGSIEGDVKNVKVFLVHGNGEFLILDGIDLKSGEGAGITGNVFHDINITNETANVVNVSNVTIPDIVNDTNVTSIVQEIIEISFSEVCVETCDLSSLDLKSDEYELRIEIPENPGIVLKLDSVEYEIIEEVVIPEMIKIEKREEKIEKGKKGKIVKISGPDNVVDVPVSTEIEEIVKLADVKKIKVYWIEEKRFIDFVPVDSDGDGLIDNLEWDVPHLSNQTFEIVIDVLNIQSYPVVGGEWEVEFTTLGIANLTITAINGTTWIDENETLGSEDLRFLDLKCGNEIKTYEWQDGRVFVEDYSCDETGFERSQVLTPGVHSLEFQFGEDIEYAYNLASDFKIQRGNLIISSGSLTGTITEGIDFDECIGPCFVKLVSTRNSGMGQTSGGGTQNFVNFETYISDISGLTTVGGDVIFERNGNTNDNRLAWEIWEYTGQTGADNEIQVLDSGVCTFTSGSTTCDGAVIAGGATDDADVVVYVTGRGNPAANTGDNQRCMVTSEWVAGSNIPRFTRDETGNGCDISYAIVEFTGANWNVQRVEHSFSAAATQTETITDVVDISKAFYHTQQRNAGGGAFDGLCQSGSEVELTDSTTLTFRLPQATNNWGTNMNAVTWVIWNTQSDGQPMIVNHYNPLERVSGGLEEDNWQETINILTYDISEAAVSGMTAQSAGCGTAFPRSYITGSLTDATTIDFWQSDSGQPQEYTFQVVEFPTAALSNFPPSNPSDILCDGVTNCNIAVDTSVLMESVGSTDIELDAITYHIEAFLESDDFSGDQEAGVISILGESGVDIFGESGDVSFTGFGVQSISFGNTYTSAPVVVAVPATDNSADDNGMIPVIDSVSVTGFDLNLCKDDGTGNCEATFTSSETVHYFVFDVDAVNDPSIDWIEAGTNTVTTVGADTLASFTKNFANVPYVFSTIQTDGDGGTIIAPTIWTDSALLTSVQLIGCAHPGTADVCTSIGGETAGWVAIDPVIAPSEILSLQIGTEDISDSTWTPIIFSPVFITPRVMVMQNDDDGAQDPQYSWARNILSSGADIRYCEQDISGDCDTHTSEFVRWFALETDITNNIEVGSGIPDTEIAKPFITYNNIIPTSSPAVSNIEVSVFVSAFDSSGSVFNANLNPDLEIEVFDGTSFVSIGLLSVSGPGTFTISTTNPAILTAWQNPANADIRIRGVNFDYFDETTFDNIDFDDVSVNRIGQDWSEIGTHSEGFDFNWDTSLISDQICVDLRSRATDPLGSNLFSDYFTEGTCLEINHPDAPTIVSINPISNVILNPGTTTDVTFQFTAEDLDGAADLDDLTASATFSKTGEISRIDSDGCAFVSPIVGNQKTYECVVPMQFYDASGLWDVTVTIEDSLGLTAFDTTTFFVELLQAISITPGSVSFPTIFPEGTNIGSSTSTTVTNEGNSEIPADSDLSILAHDLSGETTPSEIIEANRFRVAPAGAGDACLVGDFMGDGTTTVIFGFTLNRGASGNTQDLNYCITTTPAVLSVQSYSATGASAWTITVLLAAISIRSKKRRKKKSNLDLIDEELKEKYGVGLKELVLNYRKESNFSDLEIPMNIFSQGLSPAEAVCKYLKENKGMKYSEISRVLNRDERTVWINYRNAVKKMKRKFDIKKESIFVEIEILSNRKLSILESLVLHFKEKGMRNSEIAKLLGKGLNNVWTLYKRALKKMYK